MILIFIDSICGDMAYVTKLILSKCAKNSDTLA